MKADYQIPEPVLFNLLKHHLAFIKDFMMDCSSSNLEDCPPAPLKGGFISSSLRRIGTTVMDIYSGDLKVKQICDEITEYLRVHDLTDIEKFSSWTGSNPDSFRKITLSDNSLWTMKFQNDHNRYVHIFPARNSKYTFRVKGNTLKSALIYLILIGKDLVTAEDLNKVRPLLGLSPVKSTADAAAIVELIEMLRG